MAESAIIASREKSPSGVEIAEWLRERIRRNRLVPGQRLIEADITGETGASRSKVREALLRLETEGLIIIEEFRGASVRRTSMEEVRQIYRARVALESLSAADFTANASPEQKQRLVQLQAALDDCVATRAAEQFERLNREWHELIVAGSGNALVAEMLQRLSVPIYRLMFESFYNEARLKAANADHQRITQAILSGTGAEAEAAMRRHIEDGFATMSEIDSEFHS